MLEQYSKKTANILKEFLLITPVLLFFYPLSFKISETIPNDAVWIFSLFLIILYLLIITVILESITLKRIEKNSLTLFSLFILLSLPWIVIFSTIIETHPILTQKIEGKDLLLFSFINFFNLGLSSFQYTVITVGITGKIVLISEVIIGTLHIIGFLAILFVKPSQKIQFKNNKDLEDEKIIEIKNFILIFMRLRKKFKRASENQIIVDKLKSIETISTTYLEKIETKSLFYEMNLNKFNTWQIILFPLIISVFHYNFGFGIDIEKLPYFMIGLLLYYILSVSLLIKTLDHYIMITYPVLSLIASITISLVWIYFFGLMFYEYNFFTQILSVSDYYFLSFLNFYKFNFSDFGYINNLMSSDFNQKSVISIASFLGSLHNLSFLSILLEQKIPTSKYFTLDKNPEINIDEIYKSLDKLIIDYSFILINKIENSEYKNDIDLYTEVSSILKLIKKSQ